MKVAHLLYESTSGRILLVILSILLTVSVGPANSASEPGTVTIVSRVEPSSLDPQCSSSGYIGHVILKNVVETLTEISPIDGTVTPRLATSWKQVDPNTWQFSLRKGVKFHDGGDFSAEAVIFNLKRIYVKGPDLIDKKFFMQIKMEGKALDSHTLEIKTDKFEPLLPTLLSTLTMGSLHTPLDKLTRSPIGTGPYKFVKWDAATQIILERFDGYWGKQPQVKKAVYVFRGESSVRAAMVAIGEADLAPEISVQDANRPDMDSSFLNSESTNLTMGPWEPPLNDMRVRMALNYAVDRNAMRGSIFSKDVVPATQMIVPNIFGHNPDLKVWPYDPQKARQLLNEARKDGVPVDKEILLAARIGFFPGSDELMEVVLTMYRAVGLNVKLKMIEMGAYRTYNSKPFFSPGPYIFQVQHDNNKGDPVFTVFQRYHCNGNQSTICDKTLDNLIEKAQVATGEERRNLWRAAFKRIHEDIIPNVMLFHMVGYARVGKRINFKPSPAITSEVQLEQITFK